MKDKLLSSIEAAKYLHYGPQMMRLSRQNGRKLHGIDPPEFEKVGVLVVYKQSVLDRWIKKASNGKPELWESIRKGGI